MSIKNKIHISSFDEVPLTIILTYFTQNFGKALSIKALPRLQGNNLYSWYLEFESAGSWHKSLAFERGNDDKIIKKVNYQVDVIDKKTKQKVEKKVSSEIRYIDADISRTNCFEGFHLCGTCGKTGKFNTEKK